MKRKVVQRKVTAAVMIATMAMGSVPAIASASESSEVSASASDSSTAGSFEESREDTSSDSEVSGAEESTEDTSSETDSEEGQETTDETPAETPTEDKAEETPAEDTEDKSETEDTETPSADEETKDEVTGGETTTDETPAETPTETPAETPIETPVEEVKDEAESYSYTYTGEAISPVLGEGEEFVSGDTEAVNVGEYTATVSKDGEEYDLNWTIAPATLTATPVYTIKIDDTGLVINTFVAVDGFVANENEETAAGYTAPTVSAQPTTVEEAKAMKAEGGEADNYVFEYADSVESDTNAISTLSELNSDDAPFSSAEEIENGEYTVTANVYIPGHLNKVLGINAYPSNPDDPFGSNPEGNATVPTNPVYDNAKLVVSGEGETKKYTLTIPIKNNIFTIQDVKSGEGIEVVGTQVDENTYGKYPSRIKEITVELKNLSGKYTFGDCHEYPTLLSEDWYIPLNCAVMLGDIGKEVKKDQEIVYKNHYSNPYYGFGFEGVLANEYLDLNEVKVNIPRTEKDLTNAKLKVVSHSAGEAEYDKVYNKLQSERASAKYLNNIEMYMYDIEVVDENDNPIDISDARNIKTTIADVGSYIYMETWESVETYPVAYLYDEESDSYEWLSDAMKNEAIKGDGDYAALQATGIDFTTNKLGTIVFVVNPQKAKLRTFKEWNVDEGVKLRFGGNGNNNSYDLTSLNASYENLGKTKESEIKTAIGKDYAEVVNAYKVGIDAVGEIKYAEQDYTGVDLVVSVADKANDEYDAYLITKHKDGSITSERLSSSAADDSHVSIAVVSPEMTKAEQTARMTSLTANVSSFDIDNEDGSLSYIALVKDNTPEVTSLVYNGKEQVGVKEGECYTVTGTLKGTDAGEYTATATLKDGYTWSDGDTNKVKNFKWQIIPATLTATYKGEAVEAGNTPAYAVSVKGFVNGETADKLEGYEAPTITAPTNLEKGKYDLTPAGGNATNNYKFEYVGGPLYYGYNILKTPDMTLNLWNKEYTGQVITDVSTIFPDECGQVDLYYRKFTTDEWTKMDTKEIVHAGYYKVTVDINDDWVIDYSRNSGNFYDSTTNLDTSWEQNGKTYVNYTGKYVEGSFLGGNHLGFTIDEYADGIYSDEIPTPEEVKYKVGQWQKSGSYYHGMINDETIETADGWIGPKFTVSKTKVDGEDYISFGIDDAAMTANEPSTNQWVFVSTDYYWPIAGGLFFDAAPAKLLSPTTTDEETGKKVLVDDRIEREVNAIKGAEDGSALTVKLADSDVIPEEIIAAMIGKNVDVHFTGDNFDITLNTTKVAVPTAEGTSFTYTGKEIEGIKFGKEAGIAYTVSGTTKATDPGTYTATATLAEGWKWADGTTAPKTFEWSINKKQSTGSDEVAETRTVTANLYVPGELNTVLGVNAYLTNGANPLGEGGYEKTTPTKPVSNNAKLKIYSDGRRVLELDIPNPVFTLQAIGGCSNAEITNIEYEDGTFGNYSSRISHVTIELLDDSGEYRFNDCTEHPTLLRTDWNVPLYLNVNFSGGNSGLPSNDVDKDKLNSIISGGGSGNGSVSDIKVDAGAYLDSDADIESSEITSGTTADTVKKAASNVKKIYEVKAKLNGNEVQPSGKVKVYIPALDGVKAEDVKIYLVDEKTGEKTELSFKLSDDKKTYETETEKLGIFAVCTDEELPAEEVTTPAETTETANAEFKDIEKHWAKDYIKQAVEKGLFKGVSEMEFAPDKATTRAMFVTVLSRIDGVENGQFRTGKFTDVASDEWFATAVAWAEANGIVSGVSENKFAPNKDITREQMAAMLYRFAQYKGIDLGGEESVSFNDEASISDYAKEAVEAMAKAGIISGRENGSFDPKAKATRAETASMLVRFTEKYMNTTPAEEEQA